MNKKFKLFIIFILTVLSGIFAGVMIYIVTIINASDTVKSVVSEVNNREVSKAQELNEEEAFIKEYLIFRMTFEDIQTELFYELLGVLDNKAEVRVVGDKLRDHNTNILYYSYSEIPEFDREYFSCLEGYTNALDGYVLFVQYELSKESQNEYLAEMKIYKEKMLSILESYTPEQKEYIYGLIE